MKKIIFFLITAVMSLCAFAQDVIITKESKKIDAKILEVTKSEIKYKEFDYQDGPTFTLGVEDINSIIYANGKVVLYSPDKADEEPQKAKQEPIAQEEIEPDVMVDFEIVPTNDPLWYKFTNFSSGATNFRWDFGDGKFSFAKDEAMYRYDKAGIYTVTLTANVGDRKYVQRKIIEVGNSQRQVQDDEDFGRSLEQARQSGEQLGKAIGNLIAVENSYVVEIHNNTKYPYKINLDGHILGVVNGYKIERFIVSTQIYGRMQAVQTSGYIFSPTIKEYRVPPQQKKAVFKALIK